MLVAEHISKNFGATVAIADASFRIERGSFTGVIGRSGAGKSTLLRVINRLIDPSAGRIFCDGTDITALRGGGAATLARPGCHDFPAVQFGRPP